MTPPTEADACLSVTDLSQDQVDSSLWHFNMLGGDFEQAWQACDRIRARQLPDPHRFWTGDSIAGKDIIIRSLHGLGDAVQMFQYASRLKTLARSVTWQVPPNLMELARFFEDVDNVITWEQACASEMEIEITELPYLFRTTLSHLPIRTRYVTLPIRPLRTTTPRVGLAWRAGEWNQSRSIPIAALDRILCSNDFEFISLQGGPQAETDPRMKSIPPGLLTLARTIASLDVVITVDTLAAHLAGALDIPTIVLLEYNADWRWMVKRGDTPWYPSVRLCRQTSPGDWAIPLEAARIALVTLRT